MPGQHFGPRYRIVEKIGRGGMGVVYKAIDLELDRVVALKMIRRELGRDPRMVEQFKREIILAREISHENVIRIHDLGEADGVKYISMKYIEGTSLRDLLTATGRLTLEKAVSIGKQVCSALAAAHRKGVIHRDLKPQNIMIDRDGDVQVMDFGIARSLQAKEVTEAGHIVGTPHYMSPEQAQGRTGDERSDVYSLGCILYEMATGHRPFEADTLEGLIHHHIEENPRAPSELNPGIPLDLEALILKALEKDPMRRFQSAGDLRQSLDEAAGSLQQTTTDQDTRSVEAAGVTDTQASIAVLPFRDMSPDKDQEYFCEGMAEEIINALVKTEGLRVAALTSALQFKERGRDIRSMGRDLNVGTILEGSVRKAGNKLRVTAQLLNVQDGYHIWSERYDRELEDVFAIQDAISQAIVKALAPRLIRKTAKPVPDQRSRDPEAYNLYLKGRYYWNKRSTEGIRKAIDYFEQAIGKDPKFALAYAGLADAFIMSPDYIPREAYPKAKAAALKALELDDAIAEAHTSLGWILIGYEHDFRGGEKEYRKAFELNPNYATAHQWYGLHLAATGRFDEALHEIRLAQEIDPLSLMMYTAAGFILYMAGRYEEAIEECRKAMDLDPNFGLAHFPLVWIYDARGEYDKAMEGWAAVFAYEKKDNKAQEIRKTYADSGYKAAMRLILDSLIHPKEPGGPNMQNAAMVAAVIGEKEITLELLEKSLERREPELFWVQRMPAFEYLRSDPRFQRIMERIGA
jgi:serine/threonine-protein kinase